MAGIHLQGVQGLEWLLYISKLTSHRHGLSMASIS
jgi:hypothetical protein